MLLFSCTIIITLLSQRAYTQHTEPVLITVVYNFKHIYDTTNNTPASITEVVLKVGTLNSKFSNLKLESPERSTINKSSINPTMNLNVKTIPGSPIVVVTSRQLNKEIIYQIPEENKLIEIDRIGFQDYKIENEFSKIKWVIDQDVKIINDYHCQKATGNFGGRFYIAWFASELPYKYGPWKLCGLPGLILEARDLTNRIVFELKTIAIGAKSSSDYIIYDAIRPVTIDQKTYKKAIKQFEKDPISYSIAQLNSNTVVTQISFIDENGKMLSGEEARYAIKSEQKKVINNPL